MADKSVTDTGEEITWQEMRERDACKVADSGSKVMEQNEIISYGQGYPPDGACIATPPALMQALASGELAPEQSPLGLAQQKILEMFPDIDFTPLNPVATFASASADMGQAADSVAQQLDNLFDLSGGPK